jgi:purine-binding chemotaxis protein CheW
MFAVPVSPVREVLEYIKPTKLPKTVDFLKGIINVCGTGIPVVDLLSRFAIAQMDGTQDMTIIAIENRL